MMTFFVWRSQLQQDEADTRQYLQVEMTAVQSHIEQAFRSHISALDRMGLHWEQEHDFNQQ